FDYGAGPSVSDHQRHRLRLGRTDVDEVKPKTVDLGLELGEPIKPGFSRAPVILVAPIGMHFLHVTQRNSLRPIIYALAFGPSRRLEAALQVVELRIGSGNFEGYDFLTHRDASAVVLRINRVDAKASARVNRRDGPRASSRWLRRCAPSRRRDPPAR